MQLIPCAVLSLVIHPSTQHHILNRISWAFCVYLEAVSVLPQLRVMQNTKVCFKATNASPYQLFHSYGSASEGGLSNCLMTEPYTTLFLIFLPPNSQIVEPFTAHYVFALGVARFLSCAHWVLQVWLKCLKLLSAIWDMIWIFISHIL